MADDPVLSPTDWAKQQGQPQGAPATSATPPSPDEWKKQQAIPSPDEWKASQSGVVDKALGFGKRVVEGALGLVVPTAEDVELTQGSGPLSAMAAGPLYRDVRGFTDPLIRTAERVKESVVEGSFEPLVRKEASKWVPTTQENLYGPSTPAVEQTPGWDIAQSATLGVGGPVVGGVERMVGSRLAKQAVRVAGGAGMGTVFSKGDPVGTVLGAAGGFVHATGAKGAAPETSPAMPTGTDPVTGMPLNPPEPAPGTFEATAKQFVERRSQTTEGQAARAAHQPIAYPESEIDQHPAFKEPIHVRTPEDWAAERDRLQVELDEAKNEGVKRAGDIPVIQGRLDEATKNAGGQASTGGAPPGEPPVPPTPPSPPGDVPPTPPPGGEPPSSGGINPEDHLNLDKIVTRAEDPEARALLEQQVVSAVKATGQSPKQVISFAQQRLEAMALETSPEELAAKPGLLLDRREILRARIEVLGAVDEKVALDKKINDGTATAEDIARSDYLATRNQALIARLMPSASEAGRTLGAQRMLARLTTDPDFWVEQASDVARKKGGILSPADDLKVRQAAHEAGEAKKAVDQSAAAQQQAKRTGAARAKGDAIKKALAGVKDEIEQMRGEGPNTYTVIDKAEAAGLRPEKGGAEAKPVDVEKQGLDKSKDTAQGLRERDFALARLRNKAIAIQAQIDALGKDVEAIDPSVKADNSSLRAEQIKTAADAQREEPLTPGEAPKAPKNPIDQLSRWVDENEKQLDQRLSKVTQEKPTSLLNQLGKESEQRLAKARANLAKVTAESGPNSKAARLYDLWQTGLLTAAAPKAAVAHALSASVDLASYPLKVGLDVTQSAVRASASQLFQAASENEAGTTWRNKYWENRMTNFAPIEGFKARLRGAAEGAKQGAQIMNTGTSVDRFGRSSMQGTGFGRVEINYNEPEVAGVLGPVRTASATAFNSVAQAYSRTVHRVMQFAPHVIMGQEFEAKIAELARIQAKAEGATGAEYADRVKALIQNPMPSMQTEAAGYAAHLGLIDQSRYARGMTAIQRMIPGGKLVVPFPTVEGNIVGRAVEASPLGLFNEYSSFKTLFDEGMKGTEKEAARKAILTATARSGTSAAIIAGGYMLAKAGRMTRPAGVSLRPGETATDKLTGQAPGELAMFGVKGPERWYALDATGPYGILMQVGAEMYYSSLERDASVVASTGKAFGVFTRAIAESSAFTGLSTLADAARDPENMGDRYVRTLAGSVVPSIIGRTAMAVDPIDRFIGKPQGLGELPGYVGRAALSRIPFASRALPASVGAFGGEQEHDVNVMTSLGFRSTEDKGAGDPTIKAIEAAHFIISQVKQVRGESDEAFQQRQVLYGQMAKKVLTGVAANPEFQAMPATAARLIKEHPEWGPINPALLSDAIQRQIMHDELGKIEGALSSGLSPAMPRKLGGMVPRIAPDSASVARVLHNQASPDSTEP